MNIPLHVCSLRRLVAVALLSSAGAAFAQQEQPPPLPASPPQQWLGQAIALQGNLALRSIRADLAVQLRAMPLPPLPLPESVAVLSPAAAP